MCVAAKIPTAQCVRALREWNYSWCQIFLRTRTMVFVGVDGGQLIWRNFWRSINIISGGRKQFIFIIYGGGVSVRI